MTATVERLTMPLVTCHPWCIYGHGHPGEVHPDDQACFSTELDVPGTLLDHDPGYEDEAETVDVFAMGWATGHLPTQIQICRSGWAGMSLTVDEAAQVARAILETIADMTGEGEDGTRRCAAWGAWPHVEWPPGTPEVNG